MSKGHGTDFAKHENLAVYCAVVTNASIDLRCGVVTVERARVAAAAGLVINPDSLRQQIEGGIIQPTSWTRPTFFTFARSQPIMIVINTVASLVVEDGIGILSIHYGWPVYRGGPMHHADHIGLAEVVAKLKAYGPLMGPKFTISPLLERMAAQGKKFTA